MGSEIHVAIPCEQRAQRIAHRHSIDEDIGHGNRLHGEWSAVDPAFRDAEERTLEREYAVAVAAGPFRKEDEVVPGIERSEEHTSELQSIMRISYHVFCLKKK